MAEMSDFFITVTFQAQREGITGLTMRKTCLYSQAKSTVTQVMDHVIASGVLERGDTVMLQIKKLAGEPGHA